MLAALGYILRHGLRLMSLRSLGLASALRRCTHARVRAVQCTVLAGVSAALSLIAGVGALLLWVDPNLRPALLAGVAALLGLIGIALLYHARTLKRSTERVFSDSALALLADFAVLRRMMRTGRACACARRETGSASAGARAEADRRE
jgi:hypothetical protein